MANTPSAIKRIRQNATRRARNRARRSAMRSQVKRLRALIEAGDAEAARAALTPTLGLVDATAQRGAVHRNAAARTKSRLERAVAKLGLKDLQSANLCPMSS